MSMSPYRSAVTLPAAEKPYPSILAFLAKRFPRVPSSVWEQRLAEGKVLDDHGDRITPSTAYVPCKRIFYYREVERERVIPFAEQILFQNEDLLVACKPHFLPVTPGGQYVAECLLNRLRKRTGNDALVPIHRIDRATAGIVMFSANRETRALYNALFTRGAVKKTYLAVADYPRPSAQMEWLVENRIVPGEPWFRMTTAPGTPNARSLIRLAEVHGTTARFLLRPLTGKTHQLRLHMSGLGFGILNDRLYPHLQPERDDDFDAQLQLLAATVAFSDPVTGKRMEFASERKLLW